MQKNALTYDTIHCTLSGLKSLKRMALFAKLLLVLLTRQLYSFRINKHIAIILFRRFLLVLRSKKYTNVNSTNYKSL